MAYYTDIKYEVTYNEVFSYLIQQYCLVHRLGHMAVTTGDIMSAVSHQCREC